MCCCYTSCVYSKIISVAYGVIVSCYFIMCSEVLLFSLICVFTLAKTINGSSFKKTSSTFAPELLPGMDCTCIEITKCSTVCRILQNHETSALVKRRYLKNITCGYKGFIPYVCCDEKVIGNHFRFRDDPAPFHHHFPIQIPPQFYPSESMEPSASHYPFYPYYPSYPEQFVTRSTTIAAARELLPRECGVAVQERIIGGRTAALGAYPWIARLGYTRLGSRRIHYRCGGSLINDRYVITAAHCVTKLPGNLTLVSIRLGEVDERTDPDCDDLECADPVQDFSHEEIRVHNGYDSPKYQNDIALIRLNRPVNISLYVSPICLPLDHSPRKNYTGQKGIAAGWGATSIGMSSGSRSHELQWVRLAVVPRKQCAQVFENRAKIRLSDSQICAGGEKGKDSCEGDSGGPLMLPEQSEGVGIPRYVLIGLVSFGAKHCGSENIPGVYTQTSVYTDWILNNIYE